HHSSKCSLPARTSPCGNQISCVRLRRPSKPLTALLAFCRATEKSSHKRQLTYSTPVSSISTPHSCPATAGRRLSKPPSLKATTKRAFQSCSFPQAWTPDQSTQRKSGSSQKRKPGRSS